MSKILIIEDNPDSARLAQKLLVRANHEVLIAVEGEAGYEMALAHSPDVILMDLGLPDLDGQTVVGLLRQHPSTATTPIIAFTAWPQDTAEQMAAAYGCNGVILKPFDTHSFADQVERFIVK